MSDGRFANGTETRRVKYCNLYECHLRLRFLGRIFPVACKHEGGADECLSIESATLPAEGVGSGQRKQCFRLLARHFPQHGPYLGVYAQVVGGGSMRLGDRVALAAGA